VGNKADEWNYGCFENGMVWLDGTGKRKVSEAVMIKEREKVNQKEHNGKPEQATLKEGHFVWFMKRLPNDQKPRPL
jgi:hypothetical protein